MTHEHPARPPGRPPQGFPLAGAAFAAFAFALLAWPIGRMWKQDPRDWEMIIPALTMEAICALAVIVSTVRHLILARRARKATRAQPAPAAAPQALPYPTLDPFGPDALAELDPTVHVEAVDVSLDEPFVYPDVPAELGESFQRIIATIRELPEHPDVLVDLQRRYAAASARPGFRRAEEFVNNKALWRPDYDENAYAEPINTLNPALFLDQAEAILPFAFTIAAMVLVADQLPEEVWDLLAEPWESAGLGFPRVVLAG
jgi:hypothetical protein